jgi:regulator of sirC expression with transglutaminase-like and TPR domain
MIRSASGRRRPTEARSRVTPQAAEDVLRAAGLADDDAIDVAATALAFAVRRRGEAGDPRYPAHLAELARAVSAAAAGASTPAAQLAVLRRVLVDEHGYHGDRDTYDDLRNADLAAVIDRRRGLPVALSVLWLHAGRAQGWNLSGLNFPGHFVLQIEAAGERLVFDPFNDGRALGTPELRELIKAVGGPDAELEPDHYAPLRNRSILLRLQNNIKARLLDQRDTAGALFVVEGMLMLAPGAAALWREAGLLHVQQENLGAARRCLERATELAESAAARQRIAAELAAVRGRLN